MRLQCPKLWLVLASSLSMAFPIAAQSVEVIRGRITVDDGQPVAQASLIATSARGGLTRTGRTGEDGRYTITFPGGEGHYFLTIGAVGLIPRRLEIRRLGDEGVLIGDARLQRAVVVLDSVSVNATRPRPGRRDGRQSDAGGTEQAAMRGVVSLDQQGDLNRLAATVPGATLVPGADGDPAGFSVLGLPLDQSLLTLNGMLFGGTALPRDAAVSASLVTNPYDVSRGGFSGAQFNVQPAAGSNFIRRTASFTAAPDALHASDPLARALGQVHTQSSLGGLVSGPIVFDRAFYNVSWQMERRSNDLRTLLNTGDDGLRAYGVSAAAADSLTALANPLGIPLQRVAGSGSRRLNNQAKVFGTLDLIGSGGGASQTLNATFNGAWTSQTPLTQSPISLPSYGGDRRSWNAGIQITHSAYIRQAILTETTIGVSETRFATERYFGLPGGSVVVQSRFPDGQIGIGRLTLGGDPVLGTGGGRSLLGIRNQSSWITKDNRHRLKLTTEAHRLEYEEDGTRNALGTYTFRSLTDFGANTAASFTRALGQGGVRSSEALVALSLGDAFRVTRDLQIQFGVRLDGNRFLRRPAENDDVLAAFGAANDAVPGRLSISPRAGFTWTYGTARQVGAFDGAARVSRGVIRGGLGVFQNGIDPALVAPALRLTGLSAGVQQIACVGDAVPVVDWAAFRNDPGAIPDRCRDGTAGYASDAPDVTLFASDFVSPRSVRGNLQWSRPFEQAGLATTIDVIYSRNLSQGTFADLNFADQVRFGLPGESGRPVYVEPSSIVPATGASTSRDSRSSPLFNRVLQHRSDGVGATRQLRIDLSPLRPRGGVNWSATYVISNAREMSGGFLSTSGDPRSHSWAPSDLDVRHQFTLQTTYSIADAVRLTWYMRLASGLPFTPTVGSDVNGDGFANDRAYVFGGAGSGAPTVGDTISNLMAESPAARRCLEGQVGTIARRNSCRGPWTTDASMSATLDSRKVGLPERMNVSLFVSNPLGALDRALHGTSGLRGWGGVTLPDPTLLYVRGFDTASLRYRYDVNPRFGTSAAGGQLHVPAALSVAIRFDVGPSREQQTLIRQLDRGRRSPGAALDEESIYSMYGTGGIINPFAYLLRQTDSLRLTGPQADSLASMNVRYLAVLDSLWGPVAHALAELPSDYDRSAAYGLYRQAREATVDYLIEAVPRVTRLLSRGQQRMLPPLIVSHLDRRYLSAVRSGTIGDSGAGSFSAPTEGSPVPIRRVDIIRTGPP